MAGLFVPATTFRLLDGEPRFYSTTGDSGNRISRGFCAGCGSPVCVKYEKWPGIVGIAAGSLDDPSVHKPTMDIYTAMAQAWDHMGESTKKFAGAPQTEKEP